MATYMAGMLKEDQFLAVKSVSLEDACLSLVKVSSIVRKQRSYHPVDSNGCVIEILEGHRFEHQFRFNRLLQRCVYAQFLDLDSKTGQTKQEGRPFALNTLNSNEEFDFSLR